MSGNSPSAASSLSHTFASSRPASFGSAISRFFGGDPEKGEVYGYYAERKGSFALMLRNPAASPAKCSFSFPAAGEVSLTLAPYEIKFFTDLT